ncbi:hypothetical protein E0H73_42730 [Kribbella pittospori]|uniref:Uncharacterized protein n=1 Tax=Kribbella pittospori TaxID=722689 RepID=A0A4R0JPZ9_9ACTN|nr:hypothetical protein [Kribbella pittospori]TCC48527.1 hypothetical protein E0H73_42730 [Kribbella pittospori]
MPDLVHGGELAGSAGPCTLLKLLQQGLLGRCLGVADRGYVADLVVVIAVPGLRPVLDGLALLVGLDDLGGDASPGSDLQGRLRDVMPPNRGEGSLLDAGGIVRAGEVARTRSDVM